MKPAEYAQTLGISRQAVYAKIKRGILKSKNVEGKLYIVVDNNESVNDIKAKAPSASTPKKEIHTPKDFKALLQAKDETIAVLKETVVDLKESNKQISTTLRGEIDLLKDAFHEMRTMYAHQLEHKTNQAQTDEITDIEEEVEEESIEIFTHEEEPKWIGLKKFFKRYAVEKEKKQQKLTKKLTKAYKKGDERLMMIEDKLKINANKTYEDILN